jgi:hypothetical protein
MGLNWGRGSITITQNNLKMPLFCGLGDSLDPARFGCKVNRYRLRHQWVGTPIEDRVDIHLRHLRDTNLPPFDGEFISDDGTARALMHYVANDLKLPVDYTLSDLCETIETEIDGDAVQTNWTLVDIYPMCDSQIKAGFVNALY